MYEPSSCELSKVGTCILIGGGGWLEVLFSKEKMCVYEADSGCGNRKNDSGSDWLKMPRKDSGNQKCTIGSYEKGG